VISSNRYYNYFLYNSPRIIYTTLTHTYTAGDRVFNGGETIFLRGFILLLILFGVSALK